MSIETAPKMNEKKGSSIRQELLVPSLAVLSGLILGAIVILVSGGNPLRAYGALFVGSFGNPLDLDRTRRPSERSLFSNSYTTC